MSEGTHTGTSRTMGPSCGYHSFGTIGGAPFEKGAAAPLLPFRRTTGPLKRTIAFLFTIWPPLSLSLSFAFSHRPRTIPQNPIEIVGQRFRDRFNTSFSIFLFSPPGFFLSLGRTVNFTSVTFYETNGEINYEDPPCSLWDRANIWYD